MFIVVLHDVTPQFVEPIEIAVHAVTQLVGTRFACAIVPRWHGERQHAEEARLWKAIEGCDEYLLHGWTHKRTQRPGLISKLTNYADEFGGISLQSIRERIDLGQQELRDVLGTTVTGFVPPAWRLPVELTQLTQLTHLMRWRWLETVNESVVASQLVKDVRRLPVATWSFDWGRMPVWQSASHTLAVLQQRMQPTSMPCIVIHPADVSRKQLPFIVSIIRQLLDAGEEPMTPMMLLRSPVVAS